MLALELEPPWIPPNPVSGAALQGACSVCGCKNNPPWASAAVPLLLLLLWLELLPLPPLLLLLLLLEVAAVTAGGLPGAMVKRLLPITRLS